MEKAPIMRTYGIFSRNPKTDRETVDTKTGETARRVTGVTARGKKVTVKPKKKTPKTDDSQRSMRDMLAFWDRKQVTTKSETGDSHTCPATGDSRDILTVKTLKQETVTPVEFDRPRTVTPSKFDSPKTPLLSERVTARDSMTAEREETDRRQEVPPMTRLQRMRKRFEDAGRDTAAGETARPKLTAKRKLEEAVTVAEEARKVQRLVAGGKETTETGHPVEERKTSGQTKFNNNPHLFNSREPEGGGQRGGGLSYGGGVRGGVRGVQEGQRESRIAAFKPSQFQPGREILSEKQTAVIGQAAACGTARTNGRLTSSQLRITDIFGGKKDPRKPD